MIRAQAVNETDWWDQLEEWIKAYKERVAKGKLASYIPALQHADSMIRLEVHKPRKTFNPMINAGAITVASMLPGGTHQEKFYHFMDVIEQLIGRNPAIDEFGNSVAGVVLLQQMSEAWDLNIF